MVKIGIIMGSTREGRVSPQVAEWVMSFAEGRTDAEFEIVDIKDYSFEEFDNVPPGMLNKQYEAENVTRWSEKIDSLDGFIFVTPEYNKDISPSLKNAIDHLGSEWADKAAGSVSYGSTLGVAATMALRQILSNLNVAVVSPFGAVSLFADFEDMTKFNPASYHNDSIEQTIDKVVQWAKALKTIR
jgi:NAD(P)H-dependent FMN reductase